MENDLDRRLDAALQAKWSERQALLRRLLREAVPREPEVRGTLPRKGRGYTPEQFVIISILSDYGHGVTVSEITVAIDLPHANVTRTLDRLENKGLIHRKRGDEDKRQVIIRLTLEGNKAARKLAEIERRLNEALWGKLDDSDKNTLLDLLSRR